MLCDDFLTAAAQRAKLSDTKLTTPNSTPRPPWERSTPYGRYIGALCYGYISVCQGETCEMIHTRSYIQRHMYFLRFIQVIVRCRWFGKGTLGVSQCLCMPPSGFQCFVQTQQFFSSLQMFLHLRPLLSCLGLALLYSADIFSLANN